MSNERVDALRAAVRAAPEEPSLHLLLAAALAESGEFDEAASEFRETLRLRPADPQALLGLAESLAHRGQPREALKTLDELAQQPGEQAGAHMLRARLAFFSALGLTVVSTWLGQWLLRVQPSR